MEYSSKFADAGMCNTFDRLKRIRKKLKKELRLKPDDVVLDVGCNKGKLVEFLQPYCKEVVGIDINEEAVKSSETHNLKVMDARDTEFPDNYFTKVVSSHTIEHIPKLENFFAELDRILKSNGLVVLYYPWELFKGMATMRNAWIFYRNPFKGHKIHVNKLSHKKIKDLIKDTDLEIHKKKFYFDPQPGYITILKKK